MHAPVASAAAGCGVHQVVNPMRLVYLVLFWCCRCRNAPSYLPSRGRPHGLTPSQAADGLFHATSTQCVADPISIDGDLFRAMPLQSE